MLLPILAALLCTDASATGAPKCQAVDAAVDAAIAEKVRALGGSEYCEHRRFLRADVDKDGTVDQLVIFGVELRDSGINAPQVLAVFPSRSGKTPVMTQVGTSCLRFPRSLRFQAGTIVVATKEYAKTDAICSPSKAGELEYKLRDGALVLTKPPAVTETDPDNGLSQEQVSAAVRRHLAGLKHCYEKELLKNKALSGKVLINWTIKPDGHVERASVSESTFQDDAVPACIRLQVSQWEFPRAPTPTAVTFPFTFQGSSKP